MTAPRRDTPRTTHAAALALEYGEQIIVRTVRDVHESIARRTFGYTRNIGGRVPEAIHNAVACTVYDGLSASTRLSSKAMRSLGGRGVGKPIESTPRGRQVVSAINGLIGADLLRRGDPQAIVMAVRHDERDLPLDPETLAATFPVPNGHLALIVHGLGENDDSWRGRTAGSTYATRIAAEAEATPLVLRYNTGLHVSDNGAHLAELIDTLCTSWPVPVTKISLIGHSMGGLVIRAATNHGVAAGADWAGIVRNVVCLGTPHLGASLEKVVHLGSKALRLFPTASPFGRILDTRSPGIVDLRHGYITKDEWDGQDLTSKWGLNRIAAAPLVHAEYHFVAATLGPTPGHPVSEMLGDLFVRFPSATGRGRGGDPIVADAHVQHLGSTDHFALLNHPRVGDWLVGWLTAEPAALSATRSTPRAHPEPPGGRSA